MLFALKLSICLWQVFYKTKVKWDTQRVASRCKSYLHLSLGFLLYLISGTQRWLSVVGVNTKGSSQKVALHEIILNSEKLSVSVRLHFRPTFPKVQITTLIPGREPCLVSVRKRLPLGNASNIWRHKSYMRLPFSFEFNKISIGKEAQQPG